MKPMESYLMMYFLLDPCYCISPEDDVDTPFTLAEFLSGCNPLQWGEEGCPMSLSYYEDWLSENNVASLDYGNIVDAVIQFLEFYEEKRYNFGKTKEFLRRWSNPGMIRVAAKRTKLMYQKYNYPD